MNIESDSSTRIDQYIEVLEKALHKISKKISSELISQAYTGVSSEDRLFIEIAANKLLEEYEEEAKAAILERCEQDGIFDYLRQLDSKDIQLEEKKELQDKFCGSVIDVNQLLAEERMHMKKRVIIMLEKQILNMDQEIQSMYDENRESMKQIEQGVKYIKTISK